MPQSALPETRTPRLLRAPAKELTYALRLCHCLASCTSCLLQVLTPRKVKSLCKLPSILQADFIGLGVITLDALTQREWVKEDELATEIKAHPKVLRRVLRYFEQVRQSFLLLPPASVTRLALHQ